MIALVDDEDFEELSRYNWHAHKVRDRFYACRNFYRGEGSRGLEYLHRRLFGNPETGVIDHKNGQTLDCQKNNLRWTTQTKNLAGFNRVRTKKSSRFRGVCLEGRTGKWLAQVCFARKIEWLGRFDCEIDAARVRDRRAIELGFPKEGLNFP